MANEPRSGSANGEAPGVWAFSQCWPRSMSRNFDRAWRDLEYAVSKSVLASASAPLIRSWASVRTLRVAGIARPISANRCSIASTSASSVLATSSVNCACPGGNLGHARLKTAHHERILREHNERIVLGFVEDDLRSARYALRGEPAEGDRREFPRLRFLPARR